MKIEITADTMRGLYADRLDRFSGDPEIDTAPRAEDLAAEDLDEMVEDLDARIDRRDTFDLDALIGFVIDDWIADWHRWND